uniref:Uncharacterized protein n=1 Tax=Knipowitschia caucasica TaxID=637954 RepID=A0AAV2LVU2_KNICA
MLRDAAAGVSSLKLVQGLQRLYKYRADMACLSYTGCKWAYLGIRSLYREVRGCGRLVLLGLGGLGCGEAVCSSGLSSATISCVIPLDLHFDVSMISRFNCSFQWGSGAV